MRLKSNDKLLMVDKWQIKWQSSVVAYTTKPKKNFLTGFLYPIKLPNIAFRRAPRIFFVVFIV